MGSTGDAHPEDVLVAHGDLAAVCTAVYGALGVPPVDARTVAEAQVWADLRGIVSHGTRLTAGYASRLRAGRTNAHARVRLVRDGPAVAVLDGDGGLGHVAMRHAMALAMEKAAACGAGVVSVANSRHFGAASAYSVLATERGMIGFVTSNSGQPQVVPYGGRAPATANNPLSWAIPATPEPPIVLDMACAASAGGRLNTLRLYGAPLPPGLMVTVAGQPATTWEEAAFPVPAAGAKGYAMALVMSALGLLAGGAMPDGKTADSGQEQFVMALDVAQFGDPEAYRAEVGRAMAAIRAAPPAPGFDRVYLPGEIEWLRARRWRETGIPLHRDHLAELAHTAAALRVSVPW